MLSHFDSIPSRAGGVRTIQLRMSSCAVDSGMCVCTRVCVSPSDGLLLLRDGDLACREHGCSGIQFNRPLQYCYYDG